MAAGFKSSARPVLCRAPGPCAEVFLGADHTVLRTRDGGLYSCGRGDSGQLGQGDMHHYFEPTRVAALNADPLRLVAVAGARTVGVSSQDNFYIWGKSWGDGHGGVRALRGCKSHTPTVVAALSKKCIESVSIGSEHGSACDNIGTVYTFGSSNEHLQLGTVTPWPEEGEQVDPLKVNVNEATSVRAVVCGSNHSLSVTSEDEGYTWGCNMNGQLGLGHKRPTQRPALLGSFKKKAAQKLLSQVFAGGDYNAVFANDIGPGKAGEQQLYMWGKNLYGQLGLGHTTEMSTPQHMNHLSQPIRLLSCGPNHVLAVCGENSVYAWGRGVHGQLGNGYVSKQTKPRLITNLASSQVGTIVHVGAGDNHSACVTSKGAVYTWGSDLYGQLGIGEGKSASSRVGLDADVELPSLDTSLSSPVKFDENLRSFGTVTREHFDRSLKEVNSKRRLNRSVDLSRYQRRERPNRNKTAQMGGKGRPQVEKSPIEELLACSPEMRRHQEKRTQQSDSLNQFISGLASRLGGSISPQRGSEPPRSIVPNVGDFSYHARYAKTASKNRRMYGRRAGTMRFIDGLLEARADDEWIAANPEKWQQMKSERGGITPEPL